MSSSSLSWEFPNFNGNLNTPFEECSTEPKASFEKLWKDARGLEDEIEILKWMARRKQLEWDCAKELVDKKKSTIKAVKKKINMVRTVNDLGPQLNVDSDDEDTPFEDDDDEDSQSDDNEDLTGFSNNGTDVRFCLRQPSPVPEGSSLVSENYPNKFTIPDFVCKKSRFESGHLCLKCKEKPPLGLCNVCKNHWYCSTNCQTKDWPEHQKMCTNEL